MNKISFGETKMSRIKHSKIKNTGIIFELLTKKLTIDILNGQNTDLIESIIYKYFNKKTALNKEYFLYKAIVDSKFTNEKQATEFLNEVIIAHRKIDKVSLNATKYKLYGDIQKNFPVDTFFKPKVDNYKLFASIYKIFKSKSLNEEVSPNDIVDGKFTIINHLLGKDVVDDDVQYIDESIEEYKKLDKNTRILAYKNYVDKFNTKYASLLPKQKLLLKEYINSSANVNSLKIYLNEEIPIIENSLKDLNMKTLDTVTRIKINEVINQMGLLKNLNTYDDEKILAILNLYELIHELKGL